MKTVTLSEDAYAALARLKKEGESFSDVVRRLARGSRSLLEFAGDWKDFPGEKMTAYLSFLKADDRLLKAEVRRELGAAGSEWTGQGRGVVARCSLEQRPTAVARTHALETSGEPKCVTAPMAPSWKLFVRRSEKRWSFTDCTSFVLMNNLDLRKALAFDRNFVEAGFAMIP